MTQCTRLTYAFDLRDRSRDVKVVSFRCTRAKIYASAMLNAISLHQLQCVTDFLVGIDYFDDLRWSVIRPAAVVVFALDPVTRGIFHRQL